MRLAMMTDGNLNSEPHFIGNGSCVWHLVGCSSCIYARLLQAPCADISYAALVGFVLLLSLPPAPQPIVPSSQIVYDNGNRILWTTNTAGRGTAPRRFQVQNDGNALIADANNKALWVTYTAGM